MQVLNSHWHIHIVESECIWRSNMRKFLLKPGSLLWLPAIGLSLAFFLEGLRSEYSALSGDQINILTACIKQDFPNLLRGDLIVGDAGNVDYYTPWFVNMVPRELR